jgi:hypothetical protein
MNTSEDGDSCRSNLTSDDLSNIKQILIGDQEVNDNITLLAKLTRMYQTQDILNTLYAEFDYLIFN